MKKISKFLAVLCSVFLAVPAMAVTETQNTKLIRGNTAQTGNYDITGNFSVSGRASLNAPVRKSTPVAINVTATVTAAQLSSGTLTSTSAAAVSMTLPTATLLGQYYRATQGTVIEFYVDNTAGANTVTVVVGSGIVVAKQTGTGLTANDQLLTVAASATVGVGRFAIYFSSATAAVLYRIG